MAEIEHEIKLRASASSVFAALSSRAGMQGWHTALVEGTGAVGSIWHLQFPGQTNFGWLVTSSDADRRVAWECVEGPGDSVGTDVEYLLTALDDGRTLVEQRHSGWPGTGGNFRKCNTLWGVLLHQLSQYVETERPAPVFS